MSSRNPLLSELRTVTAGGALGGSSSAPTFFGSVNSTLARMSDIPLQLVQRPQQRLGLFRAGLQMLSARVTLSSPARQSG